MMTMEWLTKSKPVFILTVLSVALLVLNIGSCISSLSQGAFAKKEMAQRIDAEEKMTRANQENFALQEKLKSREKELSEEKSAALALKKVLAQEQMVGQTLKDELQRVTKLKEALEEDLKKALLLNKKAKK